MFTISNGRSLTTAALAAAAVLLAGCAQSAAPPTETAVTTQVDQAETRPTAQTAYGQVRGVVENGVQVFKGIPYGADTRDRRFQRALPPQPWTGIRDAISFADSTPQVAGATAVFSSWIPDPLPDMSEDMLGLNIWTPATDAKKRPVMVWLHGGGFQNGSGSSNVYDGVRLANRGDVVVVSINHRLNIMGYLYLKDLGGPDYADSGNIGNLDMVMALEWVRDNIANFGGDPDNVLIFGESGGGRKVSTLLAMPEAEGLIDRAIVQSGSHLRVRTPQDATAETMEVLRRLDVSPDDLGKLKTLPTQAFIDALTAPDFTDARALAYGPVLDGRSFQMHPFDGLAAPSSRDVPMLIGSNDDELSLWLVSDREIFTMGYDGIEPRLKKLSMWDDGDLSSLVYGYRAAYPDEKPWELLYTIASDGRYGTNAVRQAQYKARQSGGAPAWLYHFEWQTPVASGVLKTPHALELAFVFDNLAKSTSFAGQPTAQSQALADKMADAWIAFARNGDPNTDALPNWSPVTSDNVTAMRFGDEVRADDTFYDAEDKILRSLPSRR